ncbi:hypothetical protein N1F78_15655 [Seonamhaeicola sp. MEBiC1930]|uniref:hypothetical protein n=1 Tax=Seonamhaeicola sp. MEBiC01930 TaxID=2976768 RepID=UPI00324FF10E
MNKLREHIAFKIATLLLVVILFAPVAIKFAHLFEHHEHTFCIGEKSTHIHKVDLDCEFNEFQLNKNLSFTSIIVDLFSEKIFIPEIESHYVFLSKYQHLHFSLRGPPQLI